MTLFGMRKVAHTHEDEKQQRKAKTHENSYNNIATKTNSSADGDKIDIVIKKDDKQIKKSIEEKLKGYQPKEDRASFIGPRAY